MRFLSPFDELINIQDQLNRMFEETIGQGEPRAGLLEHGWVPRVDLLENSDEYLVRIDLPGFSKDNIDISFFEHTLSLNALREDVPEAELDKFCRKERFTGHIKRNVTLPGRIEREKVTATYKNGMLEIHCPKAEEEKPRQITIKE